MHLRQTSRHSGNALRLCFNFGIVLIILSFCSSALAQVANSDSVRANVTRDTWVSNVGDEKTKNNGGAEKLKTKGNQEMSILDIDPQPLVGRVVTGATLHFHARSKE